MVRLASPGLASAGARGRRCLLSEHMSHRNRRCYDESSCNYRWKVRGVPRLSRPAHAPLPTPFKRSVARLFSSKGANYSMSSLSWGQQFRQGGIFEENPELSPLAGVRAVDGQS